MPTSGFGDCACAFMPAGKICRHCAGLSELDKQEEVHYAQEVERLVNMIDEQFEQLRDPELQRVEELKSADLMLQNDQSKEDVLRIINSVIAQETTEGKIIMAEDMKVAQISDQLRMQPEFIRKMVFEKFCQFCGKHDDEGCICNE